MNKVRTTDQYGPGGQLNRDSHDEICPRPYDRQTGRGTAPEDPEAFPCPHGANMDDCPTCEAEDYDIMRKNAEFMEDGAPDEAMPYALGVI
ncbi:MAG: hypothetical protein ACJ8R9_05445 [Steroidobacteraceae bacterium]